MPTLNLFPARVAIGTVMIDGQPADVMMTPEFFRALSDLLQRVGGPSGPDAGDIVAIANEALQNSLDALLTQADDAPAAMAEIRKAVDAISVQLYQSYAALAEASKVLDGVGAQFFQSIAATAELSKRADGLEVMASYSDQQRVNWERPGAIGSLTPNNGTFLVLRGNSLAKIDASAPTAQSIPNNTVTTITNWTENTDINNNFNPVTGVFTAPRAGWYLVCAEITFASALFISTSEATVVLFKNAVQVSAARYVISATSTTAFSTPHFSREVLLATGDTLTIKAFQNSGGAVNTQGTSDTFLTISEKP